MMNRTAVSAKVRDLARRLLSYEAAEGYPSEAGISAAVRVCEELRRPLNTLGGASGSHALLRRALTLAKAEVPCLSAAQVKPDGSLDGLNELPNDEASEAGVMLIAQLLGLLVNFVGEPLTLRLLQGVWPDLPLGDANSGGAKSK